MIEKEVLIPTVLCDAGAKHEVLPELHDEDDMFEYTLTVMNKFDKESIRYQSVLDCLSQMRKQGLIN